MKAIQIKVIKRALYNLEMQRADLMDQLVQVRWGMTMTNYGDDHGYFVDYYDPDCESIAREDALEDMITQLDWEMSQKQDLLEEPGREGGLDICLN